MVDESKLLDKGYIHRIVRISRGVFEYTRYDVKKESIDTKISGELTKLIVDYRVPMKLLFKARDDSMFTVRYPGNSSTSVNKIC